MKQIHLTILKYLDKHDTGDFIDVQKAFKNKLHTRAEIERAYDFLKEYIELESLYEHQGFDYAGEDSNFERPLQKARIKKEGSEYLRDCEEKRFNRNLAIFAGLAIPVIVVLIDKLL